MRKSPAVNLANAQETWNYVNLQKRIFPEVRICDEDDFTVVHVLDGKIVFPQDWVEMEKKMNEVN
ncbi:hypothetical protein [Bacillus thuringiensis]|nr:hypothetical protein [Bacillus thuringiensis]